MSSTLAYPIDTGRLLLRPFTGDDAPALAAVFADPLVMRFVADGTVRDFGGTRTTIDELVAHEERHGFSVWAVVEKASGRLIGEGGLNVLRNGPDVELAYVLARDAWGRGLATELGRVVLDVAFGKLALDRVVALVYPANAASLRVVAKLGMSRAGPWFDSGLDVHELSAARWRTCRPRGVAAVPAGTSLPVETPRLVLRPFVPADAADVLRLFGDPDVMRYWNSAPLADLSEALDAVEHFAAMQRRYGFAQWHASEKAAARFVGAVGLQPLEQEEVELMYALLPAARGRGLAAEAAAAALSYGFDEAGLGEIVAIARDANTASLRVMRRLGMRRAGRATHFGSEWEKYAVTASEWRGLRERPRRMGCRASDAQEAQGEVADGGCPASPR